MSKVTVKQFLDAGFKFVSDDMANPHYREKDGRSPLRIFEVGGVDDWNGCGEFDDKAFVYECAWRKNTGTQPVGDDCPVIVEWWYKHNQDGTDDGLAKHFEWGDHSITVSRWKPDLEAIAQLDQSHACEAKVVEYSDQLWFDCGNHPTNELAIIANCDSTAMHNVITVDRALLKEPETPKQKADREMLAGYIVAADSSLLATQYVRIAKYLTDIGYRKESDK